MINETNFVSIVMFQILYHELRYKYEFIKVKHKWNLRIVVDENEGYNVQLIRSFSFATG